MILTTRAITIQKFLVDIIAEANSRNHTLCVAPISSDRELEVELSSSFNFYVPDSWYMSVLWLPHLIYKIGKQITKFKPDIIYCHTAGISFVARILGLIFGISVVYHVHGFRFYYKRCGYLKNKTFFFLEFFFSFLPQKYIVMNLHDRFIVRRLFKRNFNFIKGVGLRTKKYSDVCRLNRERLEKSLPTTFKIVVVSRLSSEKGLEDICKLALDLGSLVTIDIYGFSKDEFIVMFDNIKIPTNINFHGWVNDNKQIFGSRDLFVHLSEREGLPRAVQEAMASGVAVLASRCRGCRDLISNGYNGWLCNDVNDQTAILVRSILMDRGLRSKVTARARKDVEMQYESIFIAKRCIDALEDLGVHV